MLVFDMKLHYISHSQRQKTAAGNNNNNDSSNGGWAGWHVSSNELPVHLQELSYFGNCRLVFSPAQDEVYKLVGLVTNSNSNNSSSSNSSNTNSNISSSSWSHSRRHLNMARRPLSYFSSIRLAITCNALRKQFIRLANMTKLSICPTLQKTQRFNYHSTTATTTAKTPPSRPRRIELYTQSACQANFA